jgi:hypothetical protein
VDRSDALIAVWDRRPAAGLGGTAHVVQYAIGTGCPVTILDPVNRVIMPPARRD